MKEQQPILLRFGLTPYPQSKYAVCMESTQEKVIIGPDLEARRIQKEVSAKKETPFQKIKEQIEGDALKQWSPEAIKARVKFLLFAEENITAKTPETKREAEGLSAVISKLRIELWNRHEKGQISKRDITDLYDESERLAKPMTTVVASYTRPEIKQLAKRLEELRQADIHDNSEGEIHDIEEAARLIFPGRDEASASVETLVVELRQLKEDVTRIKLGIQKPDTFVKKESPLDTPVDMEREKIRMLEARAKGYLDEARAIAGQEGILNDSDKARILALAEKHAGLMEAAEQIQPGTYHASRFRNEDDLDRFLGGPEERAEYISFREELKGLMVDENNLKDHQISERKDIQEKLLKLVERIDTNNTHDFTKKFEIIKFVCEGPKTSSMTQEQYRHHTAYRYMLRHLQYRFHERNYDSQEGEWQNLNFSEQQNYDTIIENARAYSHTHEKSTGPGTFFFEMNRRRTKLKASHEFFRGLPLATDNKAFLNAAFNVRSSGSEYLATSIPGIQVAKRHLERQYYLALSLKKNEWLTTADLTDVERRVEEEMRRDSKNINLLRRVDVVKTGPDKDDKYEIVSYLSEWEIREAITHARNLSAMLQRRTEVVGLGPIPESPYKRFSAPDNEFITRIVAALKFLPERFFMTPEAQLFIEYMQKEIMRLASEGGKRYTLDKNDQLNPDAMGLYGNAAKAMVIVSSAGGGPASSGNRASRMYFDNKEYSTEKIGNENMTLYAYLQSQQEYASHEIRNEILRRHPNLRNDSERKIKEEIENTQKALSYEQKTRLLAQAVAQGYITREDLGKRMTYRDVGEKIFNQRIHHAIDKQRLSLGVLLRWNDIFGLDDTNKKAIWTNAVQLNPSRTASFLPDETRRIIIQRFNLDSAVTMREVKTYFRIDSPSTDADEIAKEVWKKMSVRLGRVEEERVSRDAEYLQFGDKLENGKIIKYNDPNRKIEADAQRQRYQNSTRAQLQGSVFLPLDSFFGNHFQYPANASDPPPLPPPTMPNIEDVQKDVVRDLINLGLGNVDVFNSINFPFTAFLEDAPREAFNRLNDQDLVRHFIDQSDNQKAMFQLMESIGDPGKKPEDIAKAMQEVFNTLKGPIGKNSAQKEMEAPVLAYAEIAGMNFTGKWFGEAARLARIPRSEVERYNREARLALNEQEQLDFIRKITQLEILNDNPLEANKDGLTQYQRVRKRLKIRWQDLITTYWFRMMLLLFPIELIEAMLKITIPDDVRKSVGIAV